MRYHVEHCWAAPEGDRFKVGLSALAVEKLGEIIYIDLPARGDRLTAGQAFGEIESTKTTAELIAPLSGRVVQVNAGLEDEPAPLNAEPEGAGWVALVEADGAAGYEALLGQAEYLAATKED